MLNIGLAIHKLLTDDAGITGIVGDKIYPSGVPNMDLSGENIQYPLIIYGRTGINAQYFKDMPKKITASVTVDIWAASYATSVDLAMKVVAALENQNGTVAGVRIQDSFLTSANEAFDLPNFFGQILIFEFR